MSTTSSLGSLPCGACRFLRRKCVQGCVFAPYFCHEQGAAHFAAVHKVFGASNASKLLAHLPAPDRTEAALTISYEAQARLHDPVYGCVSHIFALQQQVVNLRAQLASLEAQTAVQQELMFQNRDQAKLLQQSIMNSESDYYYSSFNSSNSSADTASASAYISIGGNGQANTAEDLRSLAYAAYIHHQT